MPGGGLYRRVAQAAHTAAAGPEALAIKANEKLGGSPPPEAEPVNDEDVCDVRAFSVWYWNEDGAFQPETMYLNAKDVGRTAGEPRLVVSLSSFEALSQAYVMAIEKEGIKAALLQEQEDLLAAARVGYHKELLHLRELLSMAQEQMRLARQNRLEDVEQKRKEEFEKILRETDVHYFNIVDCLEPELKAIMKDAVKQFNRDLMRENFDLRDRLALHEGTEGDDGLPERLITLLMGKGHSPAKILRILSSMISDKWQSDEFRDTMRELLGLPPVDRPVPDDETEEDRKKRLALEAERERFRKQKEAEAAALRAKQAGEAAGQEGQDDAGDAAAAQNKAMRELMKQLQAAEEEIERLNEELEKLRQQLDRMAKESDALRAQAQQSRGGGEDAPKKTKSAVEDDDDDAPTPTSRPRRQPSRKDRNQAATAAVEDSDDDDYEPHLSSPTSSGISPSKQRSDGVDPNAGRLKAEKRKREEMERKNRELEEQLRAAKEMMAKMSGMSPEDASKALQAATATRRPSHGHASPGHVSHVHTSYGHASPESVGPEPVRSGSKPRSKDDGTRERYVDSPPASREAVEIPRYESASFSFETEKEFVAERTKQKRKTTHFGSSLMDRNFDGVDRSGGYSALSGKPVSIVEEELSRERAMRLKLDSETRRLNSEVDTLTEEQKRLNQEVAYKTRQLQITSAKLANIVEQDDSDGTADVQVFCKWMIRRYGSLEQGFRALDVDSNKSLSQTEFVAALNTMGWIKIVGKRLFKVIDPEDSNTVTYPMLEEVYKKFNDGLGDEFEHMRELQLSAEKRATTVETDKLVEVRARNRDLEQEKRALEDKLKEAQKMASRAEARLQGTKDGGKVKAVERKVESMKAGYENLKSERDELTSKMTAAMWKCREAHILQVKYMREAESAKEEMRKANVKLDHFKETYRTARTVDGLESIAVRRRSTLAATVAGEFPFKNMAAALGAGYLVEDSAERPSSSPGAADAANPDSAGSPSGAIGRQSSPGAPTERSTEAGSTSRGASPSERQTGTPAPFQCPKCNTLLRMEMGQSATPATLRRMAKSTTFSGASFPSAGDEAGGSGNPFDVEQSGEEKALKSQLSPEDYIAAISDDELLFGRPLAMAGEADRPNSKGAISGVGVHGLSSAQRGAASYRERSNALVAGGQRRWQLLYADSEIRQRQTRPGSPEKPAFGNPFANTISKDSQALIAHAQKVRSGLWREAVPINEALPTSPEPGPDAAGGSEKGARSLRVVSSQSFGRKAIPDVESEVMLRSAGVGGAPTPMPIARGAVHLGRPGPSLGRSQTASELAQLLSQDPTSPSSTARGGGSPGATSQATERTLSPSGVLSPDSMARSFTSIRRSPQERVARKIPAPDRSPDHSPPPDTSQPLLVVTNRGPDANGTQSVQTGTSISAGEDSRPSMQPRPLVGSPSKLVRRDSREMQELGTASLPFDDPDGGSFHAGYPMPGKSDSKLHGAWNRSVSFKNSRLMEGGDLAEAELGSGLPQSSPHPALQRRPGGLKHQRSPTQLPQLSSSADLKVDPGKRSRQPGVTFTLSSSMPDLGSALSLPILAERGVVAANAPPVAVRSAENPVAGSASSKNLGRLRKSVGDKPETRSVGEGSVSPFETPLLYVGKPPPHGDGFAKTWHNSSNATGASHTIPAPLRKQLQLATNAFELGNHVQRHADTADNVLDVGPPVVQAAVGTGLLS